MSIEELRTQMAAAVANSDIPAMEKIAAQIVAGQKDRAKTEAAALLKESEALAGKREALATMIQETVAKLGLDKELAGVKARGFNFYIKTSYQVPGQPDVTQLQSCGLIFTQVKAPKAGGGGSTGKSVDEYGLSLQAIVDKFGTDDEKAAIAVAPSNSASWQKKQAVKKRAIAENLLAPVK